MPALLTVKKKPKLQWKFGFNIEPLFLYEHTQFCGNPIVDQAGRPIYHHEDDALIGTLVRCYNQAQSIYIKRKGGTPRLVQYDANIFVQK